MATALRRVLVFLLCSWLGLSAFIVLSQDLQVFPGVIDALRGDYDDELRKKALGEGASNYTIRTEDGETLEVWKLDAAHETKKAAIVLHGNGGSMPAFFSYQKWLSERGYTSYGLEYRGFGKSTGWPSEKGIYQDAEAIWKHVTDEGLSDVLVQGISIGTGPATYLASRHQPHVLILVAPYTSIPDVVARRPALSFLSPFLWYSFPSKDYIKKVTSTCVIATHGRADLVIPVEHTEALAALYAGTSRFTKIISHQADHDHVFWMTQERVAEALKECESK